MSGSQDGPRTRLPRWDYGAIIQIPYDSSNPWLPKSFDRRASDAFFKTSNQSIVPAAGPRSLCNRAKTKVGLVKHSASRCVALLASRNTTQGKSKTAKDQCGHERVASGWKITRSCTWPNGVAKAVRPSAPMKPVRRSFRTEVASLPVVIEPFESLEVVTVDDSESPSTDCEARQDSM